MQAERLLNFDGPPAESGDDLVLAMLRSRHPGAARLLCERYGKRVYALARRILACPEDAKDAMMETFITVLGKWPSFKEQAKFSSWVYRIAHNQACMMLRQRRRHRHLVPMEAPNGSAAVEASTRTLEDTIAGDAPSPDRHLEQRELAGRISQAIASLDPIYRDAYRMKEVDGKSLKEIATALALSEPAIKSRVHRARQELRCKLADVFYN